MARKPRNCPAGYAQHVAQRGNNRSVCFAVEEDYIADECENLIKIYSG